MSSIKSIWDNQAFKKKPEVKQEKTIPIEKELTEEVKELLDSKKRFKALSDTEYYVTVIFSTKEDKELFIRNVHIEKGTTFVDGYELANKLNVEPKTPTIKLGKPFDKKL